MERSDKKRILTKILVVIAALTLLSCCFLGSTFARYVTSGSGAASIGVAKWDVAVTPAAELDVTADANKLSPSKKEFDADTHASNPRTNTMGKFLVATIINSGDVDALVSISGDDTPVVTASKTGTDTSDYTKYSVREAAKCFKVEFFTAETQSAESATTELTDNVNVAVGDTIYIYAQVTWTSQDTSSNGDALDTWIGKYATKVSWTLTYTAVQNSQIPAQTQP